MLNGGFKSFETDVRFVSDPTGGYFEVGHDQADSRGVRLDEFLTISRPYEVKKIWLDVKNITDRNLPAVENELARLVSLYGIREISIVESGTISPSFANLAGRGFHTSYYLPTQRIKGLLAGHSTDSLWAEADRIRQQIDLQAVSAVSFDLDIYPFVVDYLQPLVPDSLEYHVWNSVKLWRWSALEELEQSDYFNDPRVETILVGYWGPGSLAWLIARERQ